MSEQKTVKSDRPSQIEESCRQKRAAQILRVFLQVTGNSVDSDEEATTLRWLEQCLLAHEQDTLIIILKDIEAGR